MMKYLWLSAVLLGGASLTAGAAGFGPLEKVHKFEVSVKKLDPIYKWEPAFLQLRYFFTDETHGWAMGNGVAWRTSDGGEHWERLSGEVGPSWEESFWFLDGKHGWYSSKHGNALSTTRDGGATWEVLEPEEASLCEPVCPPWPVQFLTPSSGFGFDAVDDMVYRSTDNGSTWGLIADARKTLGASADLEGLCFANEKEGWVVGTIGTKEKKVFTWRTLDGGTSWDFKDPWSGSSASCLLKGSMMVVWVGSTSYSSTDGGKNWDPVSHPYRGPWIYRNREERWMLDDYLWHTADDGKNWERGFKRPKGLLDMFLVRQKGREALLIASDSGEVWRAFLKP